MFSYRAITSAGVFGAAFFILSGCATTLPPLEEGDAVSPNQIVSRVKCELAEAVRPYISRDPKEKDFKYRGVDFQWFQTWTAEVDLTLVVADVAGLTTSVVATDPLPAKVLKNVGTFSQSFTVALGGGMTANATRTEQISFVVSLRDIQREIERPNYLNCPHHVQDRDLNSNLGIDRAIEMALQPVVAGLLTSGNRKAPQPPSKIKIPAAPGATGGAAGGANILDNKDKKVGWAAIAQHTDLESIPLLVYLYETTLQYNNPDDRRNEFKKYDDLLKAWQRWHYAASVNPKFKPSKAELLLEKQHIDSVTEGYRRASAYISSDLDAKKLTKDEADKITKIINTTINDLGNLKTVIAGLLNPPQPPEPPKADPPIEAFTHQVNFVVSLNGNVSPNWTITRAKGPAPASGNFLSGSRSFTHSLVITIGEGGGQLSEAAKNNRNAAALGNAINISTFRAPF